MTQHDHPTQAAPLSKARHPHSGDLVGLTRPGAGVPVVLVHGVMADAHAWRAVMNAVAPRRPVVVPNRRGRWPSGDLPERYSVETEVEDLLAWLALLDGPVDLIGHSYGGLIAVEAARRGAVARSLVLYEPVARPFASDALPKLQTALQQDDLDAAVEIINIDISGYSRAHVDTLRSDPAWAKLRTLAVPAGAELAAIGEFDFAPTAYSSLGVPAVLIAGELSRHRPPYGPSVDHFRDALRIEDVTLLEGHDHLAHVTGPLDLARAINAAVGN
ncbi:alpha/beta fold hydrolase [Nocardioides sp.]|uniref:alpha/beta fold hydrolase n=1 Tax=Nocardioides sp. TaxID=35761 RepID=UPI002734E93C|nr:alpha/beta hydrolase [Nocardioides sp.]MDP3894344.1 alpha/beta hydrolase [Nocardioides sp.]